MKPVINNYRRISRTSRLFIRLLQALMVLVPLVDAAIWISLNEKLWAPIRMQFLPKYVTQPLPGLTRMAGFGVSLLPLSLFLFANTTLIRLFRLYQRGIIFSAENVHCFRLLSRALMGWCLVGILTDPLMSLALTLHHPAGKHMLSVGLGSFDLTALLIGGILAVITWVMDEARKLKEEQDFTI